MPKALSPLPEGYRVHKPSDLASPGFDPPRPSLKKGEPDSKSPFFKGDLGGSLSTLIPCPRCVYTVAQRGRGTLNLAPLLPLWQKGLGDEGYLAKLGCTPACVYKSSGFLCW